ncbi:MAG: hypothetical protein K2Y39_06530 [Candidatus Obscuribacterales bacterium]|nr:hypothetical protein [Candidatus Obscuribacterales bacterium]
MTDSSTELELKKAPGDSVGIQQWADVFYGVLVAPAQTMRVLCDNSQYRASDTSVLFSLATVLTSSWIASLGASGGDGSGLAQFGIVICTLFGVLWWVGYSLLLFLLSRLCRSPRHHVGSAFIVTGWAFVPVYFINPVKCLSSIPFFGTVVVIGLLVWMFMLQWLAFASMLDFNHKRMFALAIGLPVVYKMTLLIGLFFLLGILF